MNIDGIKEIHCDTCDEMLDVVLRLIRSDWQRRHYIFRGQGNANDLLIPKALRRDTLFPQVEATGCDLIITNTAQRLLEWGVLELFSSLADRQGLTIPGLEQRFLSSTDFLPG